MVFGVIETYLLTKHYALLPFVSQTPSDQAIRPE